MYLNSPRFHNHSMPLYHDGRVETLPTPRGHAGVHFSDVPVHVIPATRQSFDEFRGYNPAAVSRPVATVGALSLGGVPPHQLREVHHPYAAAPLPDGGRHLVQGRLQSMGLDLHNPVTPRGPRVTVTEPAGHADSSMVGEAEEVSDVPLHLRQASRAASSGPAASDKGIAAAANGAPASFEGGNKFPMFAPHPTHPVPCDVFPNMPAIVHDNWSGCNFCEEVASLVSRQGSDKYFSKGSKHPIHHQRARGPPPAPQRAGIGALLESTGGTVTVKKLAPGGGAELEGTLRVGDVIVGVNRQEIMGMGKELIELVCGPVGSTCELMVMRGGKILPPITITRARLPSQPSMPAGGEVASGPASSEKPAGYSEQPFLHSLEDMKSAQAEVNSTIEAMRQRVFGSKSSASPRKPAAPSSPSKGGADGKPPKSPDKLKKGVTESNTPPKMRFAEGGVSGVGGGSPKKSGDQE